MIVLHFISAITFILLYIYAVVWVVKDMFASGYRWGSFETFTELFLVLHISAVIVNGAISLFILLIKYRG